MSRTKEAIMDGRLKILPDYESTYADHSPPFWNSGPSEPLSTQADQQPSLHPDDYLDGWEFHSVRLIRDRGH